MTGILEQVLRSLLMIMYKLCMLCQDNVIEDGLYMMFNGKVKFNVAYNECAEKLDFLLNLSHVKQTSEPISTKCWPNVTVKEKIIYR